MTLWRYQAVDLKPPRVGAADRRSGELAGETAADVRASLRRIGLQVIDLRPVRTWAADLRNWTWLQGLAQFIDRRLRARRAAIRAELFDSLATMLQTGLPLLEAIETIIESTPGKSSNARSMLIALREQLRGGSALGEAMNSLGSWFGAAEIAMVNAAEQAGTLPQVLRDLAERQQRAGELSGQLTSALAYPAIVALVGVGVTVFLSVKTLPDLTSILASSGIEIPRLTSMVMSVGGFIASYGLVIGALIPILLAAGLLAMRWIVQRRAERPMWLRRLYPRVLRRIAVAQMAEQLAGMLRSGVPMVEALRALAPTASGGITMIGGLHAVLIHAAERVERGEDLAQAFDDQMWFDAEFRRLLEVGQASGELDALLMRIADRYSRQAKRLIDRLASLLEPMVILALAVLVGVVVMAAVLPLLRLREML